MMPTCILEGIACEPIINDLIILMATTQCPVQVNCTHESIKDWQLQTFILPYF